MAIPDVQITVQDNGLGIVPASVANAHFKIGVCSSGVVGQVYGFSDPAVLQSTLGQGPLVDAIGHALAVSGGPVYAVPVNPSTYGTNGSITHTGPGTGTVTASLAPASTILIKVSTGGTLTNMQFQISIGGGAYSAPVVSSASAYPIPGTLTSITFAAATWVVGSIYTLDTTGVITLTTDPGGGIAASNITQSSSPLDAYSVLLTITTGGALGTAVFTYSIDGGNTVSGQIATPGGAGKYAIPNTGVVAVFSGTFTAADTYAWTTTAASFNNTDMTNAFTALFAAAPTWGFGHIVGAASNSAGSAAQAAVVDTQMTTAQGQFRFAFCMIECPTAESDSTVAAAFASFSSLRTMVCAGDVGAVSPLNGRTLRRNCAWVVAAHIAGIKPGEDPSWIGSATPVKNVASLYRDEVKTPFLDAARFTTMRTVQGRPGYYITNGNLMAPGGSDYSLVQRRRVMDVACNIVRAGELPFLNGSMRVQATTGYIDERDAQQFEAKVNSQLKAGVVATGDASASSVVVNRTTNVLSTNNLPVTVRLVPLFYAKQISTNIGFSNPALSN